MVVDPYKINWLPDDVKASTEVFLRNLENGEYDFVDFGSNHGGGFEIAARQGGRRGLGFDLQPHLVQYLIGKGHDAACMDVRALRAQKPLVDFAVCSHVLEHLPTIYDVGSVLGALKTISRDYLLISGPYFDDETYLYQQNLKILHTAMPDHLCRFKTIDLVNMLNQLDMRDYVIGTTERLKDSTDPWIFRADEPNEDLWTWDAEKNLPKPGVAFDRPIYRDFVCVVQLREGVQPIEVLNRFLWGYEKIVFRSSWRFDDAGHPRDPRATL